MAMVSASRSGEGWPMLNRYADASACVCTCSPVCWVTGSDEATMFVGAADVAANAPRSEEDEARSTRTTARPGRREGAAGAGRKRRLSSRPLQLGEDAAPTQGESECGCRPC